MIEDDESERGPEGASNFVRTLSEDALFVKQDKNARWTAYNCFNENEGTELLWLKVECKDSDEPNGIQLTDVYEHLQTWKKLDHSMLLRIEGTWMSPADDNCNGCINVVAEMCGRTSLRTYRQLHSRLGFPAIQKISRQLFKALLHIAEHSRLPVHKVTAVDVQVHPVNAKLCVLPTFIWRAPNSSNSIAAPPPEPLDAPSPAEESAKPPDDTNARIRSMLHTFAVLMVELLTGLPPPGAALADIRRDVEHADLPNSDVRQLLLACLPEPGALLPSPQELLESPLLDPRRFWNLAASKTPPRAPPLPERGDSLPSSRSLDRRFSTIGMGSNSPTPRAAASAGAVASVAAAAIAEIDKETDFTLGRVKGLDYIISVNGALAGRCIDFTVKLEDQTGGEAAKPAAHLVRFPFDLNVDVVDGVVHELGPLFNMEETDRDLTAAAMKEVIASLVPEMEHLFMSASRMSYDGANDEALPAPLDDMAPASSSYNATGSRSLPATASGDHTVA